MAGGALPFGVQGPDNGLAVEGSRLLAYEMAEDLAAAGEAIEPALRATETPIDRFFFDAFGGALPDSYGEPFAAASRETSWTCRMPSRRQARATSAISRLRLS